MATVGTSTYVGPFERPIACESLPYHNTQSVHIHGLVLGFAVVNLGSHPCRCACHRPELILRVRLTTMRHDSNGAGTERTNVAKVVAQGVLKDTALAEVAQPQTQLAWTAQRLRHGTSIGGRITSFNHFDQKIPRLQERVPACEHTCGLNRQQRRASKHSPLRHGE